MRPRQWILYIALGSLACIPVDLLLAPASGCVDWLVRVAIKIPIFWVVWSLISKRRWLA